MVRIIEVKPGRDRRGAFARWAIRYQVRTVSSTSFGVPERLLDRMPEDLLVGALVDGQPYVSASTDTGTPDPTPDADGAGSESTESADEPESEAPVVDDAGPDEIFPSAAPVAEGHADADLDAAIAEAAERVTPDTDTPGSGTE